MSVGAQRFIFSRCCRNAATPAVTTPPPTDPPATAHALCHRRCPLACSPVPPRGHHPFGGPLSPPPAHLASRCGLGGPRSPLPAHLLSRRRRTSAVAHTTVGGPRRSRCAGAPMPPRVTVPEPAPCLASPELLPRRNPL
jgi:hypothetical protein